MFTPHNVAAVQGMMKRDRDLQRVLLALAQAEGSFGLTEAEFTDKTGLKPEKLRPHLKYLQSYQVAEVRCTQVGTAGPYDYFWRLCNGLEVTVQLSAPAAAQPAA